MKRVQKKSIFSCLLILGCLFAIPAYALETGSVAADFTLKSNTGKNIRLSEQRGQVVMVNFWASWCGPCRKEMPLLNDLYNEYHKLGFNLLGVNIDEDPKLAEKVLADIPVNFPILLDSKNSVSELYGIDAMPTTVLIDRNGKVRHLHRGFKSGYELTYEQQIKALIKER